MFYLAITLLACCLWGDWLAIRDWRGGPFLNQEGESSGGYMLGRPAEAASKAVLPISCFALTALSLDVFLVELEGRVPRSLADLTGSAEAFVAPAVPVLLVLAVSVFLFMRPRLLVPPQFRAQPGYVEASWRRLRKRDLQAQGQEQPSRNGSSDAL